MDIDFPIRMLLIKSNSLVTLLRVAWVRVSGGSSAEDIPRHRLEIACGPYSTWLSKFKVD